MDSIHVSRCLPWERIQNMTVCNDRTPKTCSLTFFGSWVIELRGDAVTDFNSEERLVSISHKLHWDTKKESVRFELTEFPLV